MNICNHPLSCWPSYLHPLQIIFCGNAHLITVAIGKAQLWASLLDRAESVPRVGKAVPGHYTGKGHEPFCPKGGDGLCLVPKPKKAVAQCDLMSHAQHESLLLPGLWFWWEWAVQQAGQSQGTLQCPLSADTSVLRLQAGSALPEPVCAASPQLSGGAAVGGATPVVSRLFLLGSLPAHNQSLITSFSPVNSGVYQSEPFPLSDLSPAGLMSISGSLEDLCHSFEMC